MLGLSARAVGFYFAFGYPLALFCAIPYFTVPPTDPGDQFLKQRLRTATLLALLAPVHILFALTSVGIVRDVARQGGPDKRVLARARSLAYLGVVVSLGVFISITRSR